MSIGSRNQHAWEIIQLIADKWIEPFSPSADSTKTIGQWRSELISLLNDGANFVSTQRLIGQMPDEGSNRS